MKNLTLLLLLLAGLTFISCTDDEVVPTPVVIPDTPFITANINDVAFEADTITAAINNVLGEPFVFSRGVNTESTAVISFLLTTTFVVGETYQVDMTDASILYENGSDDSSYYTEGTLELSEFDTTNQMMQGTFSFVATNINNSMDVNTITNGKFYIEYE